MVALPPVTTDKPPALDAETLKKEYPSIPLAYELAMGSYEILLKRLDALDARIQSVMTLSVTVMALSPPLAVARGLSFYSPWFFLALAAAAAVFGFGSRARMQGTIKVLDPNELYLETGSEPIEFQNNMIAWAGEDFKLNVALLDKTWKRSAWLIALFFLQALGLVAWAVAAWASAHHA